MDEQPGSPCPDCEHEREEPEHSAPDPDREQGVLAQRPLADVLRPRLLVDPADQLGAQVLLVAVVVGPAEPGGRSFTPPFSATSSYTFSSRVSRCTFSRNRSSNSPRSIGAIPGPAGFASISYSA